MRKKWIRKGVVCLLVCLLLMLPVNVLAQEKDPYNHYTECIGKKVFFKNGSYYLYVEDINPKSDSAFNLWLFDATNDHLMTRIYLECIFEGQYIIVPWNDNNTPGDYSDDTVGNFYVKLPQTII